MSDKFETEHEIEIKTQSIISFALEESNVANSKLFVIIKSVQRFRIRLI